MTRQVKNTFGSADDGHGRSNGWEIGVSATPLPEFREAEGAIETASRSVTRKTKIASGQSVQVEKRRVQRFHLDEPIVATTSVLSVRVCDISIGGAGIEHNFPLTAGRSVALSFSFNQQIYSARFKVLRCRLQLSVTASSALAYYSALGVQEQDDESRSALRRIVDCLVTSMLSEEKLHSQQRLGTSRSG